MKRVISFNYISNNSFNYVVRFMSYYFLFYLSVFAHHFSQFDRFYNIREREVKRNRPRINILNIIYDLAFFQHIYPWCTNVGNFRGRRRFTFCVRFSPSFA